MQIVIAWMDGRMEHYGEPRAAMWTNRGDEKSLAIGRKYAESEGYSVFTYDAEREPLSRARADILRLNPL